MIASAGDGQVTSEQLKQLHVVWLAFLTAIIAYLPLPWLIVAGGADDAPPAPPGLHSLNFAALGAGVSSLVSKRWWIHSLRASAGAQPGAPVAADAWLRLRAGCVITWALSEAVAIIGLALAIVVGQPLEGVAPAVAAGLLLYLHRPDTWPLDVVGVRKEVPA